MNARSIICLIILGAILVFCFTSCAGSAPVSRTTTTANGVTTITEAPVMSPEDAAFQRNCEACLNSKF